MAVFPSLLLLLCIFVHQALSIPQFPRPLTSELPSEDKSKIWVVLVSGSRGWWDYEDQASVCHAWHMFIDNGVDPDNIITMMYDDIANNTKNPYPGKIFNHPNGTDVYEGVRIDYKGEDVSPENFMGVLLGNKTTTNGKPVLKSTKNDKVFVYYTDHGGSGIVAFPSSLLTVKSLTETLEGMHERKMYKELTFYLPACQSGSMFGQNLPANIYAVSSTNADEPGYRCFCDTKLIPGVCIGHVFSVVWMEDTEQGALKGRTLADEFKIMQNKTLHPTTVDPDPDIKGSHVQAFGDLNIQKELLSEFMGKGKAPSNSSSKNVRTSFSDLDVYPTRDTPLLFFAQQKENGLKIQILLKNRRYLEKQMNELVRKVLQKEDSTIQRRAFKSANLGAKGITQLECHHQVMHAFNDHCFNFGTNPYALKYSYMLTNLCELGIGEGRIKATMLEHCANLDIDELEIKENSTIQRRAFTMSSNAISAEGITQLECHHQVMHAFNDHCFNFGTNPYALKYSYMLTNLCELGIDEGRIKATMLEHCANLDTQLQIV